MPADRLSDSEAEQVSLRAGEVFHPRTPIDTRELFAGRWAQLTAVVDAVNQTGLHAVIYGERGVGKTSLANVIGPVLHVFDTPADERMQGLETDRLVIKVNAATGDTFTSLWRKAFSEIVLSEVSEGFGFSTESVTAHETFFDHLGLPAEFDPDRVRRLLGQLGSSVFIFDEFDRLPRSEAADFTDLIKALSDFSVAATVVIVGVSDTIDHLVADHESIARAITQIPMPRMDHDELRDILKKANDMLGIGFAADSANRIVRLSQGLPHYTHLVGLAAVRAACEDHMRSVSLDHADQALRAAVTGAQQSITSKYLEATRSAQKAIYAEVLLACAVASSADADELGYFQPAHVLPPLSRILGKEVDFSTFNKHLNQFAEDKRGRVLERAGQTRRFRYRFRNPLLPPFIIIKAISSDLMSAEELEMLTRGSS